jgi:SAM-dependent methyltransferase
LDFSPTAAEHARHAFGLNVTVGTWPGAALADRTFDAITAWHALEHLPDPVAWVRHAAQHLAPGGYLLVACPNSASWGFRVFGPHWFPLDVPRHLCHFTTTQLTGLLTGAGLKVESVRQQPMSQTIRQSAERRAGATGAARWRFLARQRWLWSAMARLSGWCRQADCVVLRARKPALTALSAPPTSAASSQR